MQSVSLTLSPDLESGPQERPVRSPGEALLWSGLSASFLVPRFRVAEPTHLSFPAESRGTGVWGACPSVPVCLALV